MCDGALISWGWRTPAYPWGVLNEFLILLCLCEQFMFSLLNCSYLNPHKFSQIYPSDFLLHPAAMGVSKHLGSQCLVAGWN